MQVLVFDALGFWELLISQSLWESKAGKTPEGKSCSLCRTVGELPCCPSQYKTAVEQKILQARPGEKRDRMLPLKSIRKEEMQWVEQERSLKMNDTWNTHGCPGICYKGFLFYKVSRSWPKLGDDGRILRPCLNQWKNWVTQPYPPADK